ncbi:unnamed protein product, partial [Iphiclides podalirius]
MLAWALSYIRVKNIGCGAIVHDHASLDASRIAHAAVKVWEALGARWHAAESHAGARYSRSARHCCLPPTLAPDGHSSTARPGLSLVAGPTVSYVQNPTYLPKRLRRRSGASLRRLSHLCGPQFGWLDRWLAARRSKWLP